MEGVAAPPVPLSRRELVVATALAALPAALLVAFVAPTGDAPAHLYRTLLVREGVPIWDNLWFGGQYPLASYSFLYYLPAAVVGNVPLVLAAVVVSAVLFASIAHREWGAAARWPARAFAVLACGPLFTGTYSYALGLAALLGALRALQARRTWLAVGCAALTLGFSPLAFAFLCLVLLAVFVARRRAASGMRTFAAALVVLAAIQLAVVELFPSHGVYPFRALELLTVLTVSALGTVLAVRAERGAALAAFFVLWALVSIAAFAVPSPFGENLTRLRSLVFPLMLLTALLARFRPRWIAVAAVGISLAYNVAPYAAPALGESTDPSPAEASFWAPTVDFLKERVTSDYRVEVVPTYEHWEAYWVPKAGLALARGWYRQVDIAENPLFYEPPLTPEAYRLWLRRMGVKYVVVPSTRLGRMGARREADLVSQRRSGLVRVFTSPEAAIYELPDAVPILTGPASSGISALDHERIAGWTSSPGEYLLRVRHTRYWQVAQGNLCISAASNGMTRISVDRSGPFVLTVADRPGELIRSMLGGPARCSGYYGPDDHGR